jgi:Antitoxin SocA-like, Panacea domain
MTNPSLAGRLTSSVRRRGGFVATGQHYDRKRFEELVLYIAKQTHDDPNFGRTKLAKVLFYCDFDAYAEEGRALTGATYRAFEFGPFPSQLPAIERRLQESGRARVDRLEPIITAERGEYDPWKIQPLDEPDLDVFELWELEFVRLWIRKISEATAGEISEFSHEHPGWKLAEAHRDEIPYETALLSTSRPRPEVMELARRRFAESGNDS